MRQENAGPGRSGGKIGSGRAQGPDPPARGRHESLQFSGLAQGPQHHRQKRLPTEGDHGGRARIQHDHNPERSPAACSRSACGHRGVVRTTYAETDAILGATGRYRVVYFRNFSLEGRADGQKELA